MAKIEKLSEESTGPCPRCGEGAAYPYSVEGLDGFIDSCEGCKDKVAEDALYAVRVASGYTNG